ncbi:endoplasmic reticulum membrane sensor NFE2L1a [Xiphophorus couchianus]|uniref:endoplasmic reticulum membrane sensor NFE2L1a n=1 Tax=Xiphophorus couchianus TaxID=32473 RepID=UPI0010161E7B|nr:endoplasmic reticulum membrane sensor NFE2L1-like [Xiphophorus couchianus]XP_027878747.1 endoplasmic reticulum membrane sensor NFE2L1-like [Xiphophorus couchianus]
MLHIKEYFTEGLIQMAILLSLCGVRVDVGLEAFMPPSWCELILGPTSALTHTQILNLRNRYSLHPKTVDLDQFFTARRLLGWVRSLDRIQVPQAELETWLVQQEAGPLSGRFPDQNSLMDRTPGQAERVQSEPTMEQGEVLDGLEDGEQRTDVDRSDESSDMLPENQPLGLDLELQWQDLMDILEPENTDVEMMTCSNRSPDSRTPATAPGDGSEAPPPCSSTRPGTEPLTGTFWQQDLFGTANQLEQEPVLLPLTPSDELDEDGSVINTGFTLGNSRLNSWTIPSNYTDLLDENPTEDTDEGMNGGDNLAAFSMNLLTRDISPFSSDSPSYDLKTPSVSQATGGNDLDQDFGQTSSSSFVLAEEDADGFPSHISDLLKDLNILEDIQLLAGELEEGFSPELEARSEEEEQLHCDGVHQGADRRGNWMEDQEQRSRLGDVRAEAEVETDSDSGLSLDFIHSPSSSSSSIVSEGSADDSSSSCASAVGNVFSDKVDSSDEDGSAGPHLEVEVTIKQEEVEEDMGAVGGHGAPWFPANHEDSKLFPGFSWLEHIGHDHTYNNPPLSSLSSPAPGTRSPIQTESSVRAGRARPCRRSSSSLAPETKTWSRDKERARALRIPFSYQLIVNLPVEEFNHLLSSGQLSQQQLTLIRDIRRRGKNKIAAQNCRKRKLDVLLALEEDLKALRLQRSELLQEKRNSLRRLQDMKSRFGRLHQEIFSQLADDNGRPLDATEYTLRFGPDDTVTVASVRASQSSKKHRGVKKRRS